ARRVLLRVRIERERLIVRLRGFALVFSVVQSFIQTGESVTFTWALNGLLLVDWAVTAFLLRQAPARHLRTVGALGLTLAVARVAGVLVHNRKDAADPVFLLVLFLSLEAALRWGRWGGFLGGIGSALLASAWGWTIIDAGHTAFEHAT